MREEVMAARRVTWEAEKRKSENRSEVRRAEMVSSFREASWLDPYDQARAETRTAGLGGKLAAVLTVRRNADRAERLELHGLWTCVSEPELSDYEFTAPGGTDFLWLAVPAEMSSSKANAKAPRMVGILELTRERTLRVVRAAQRRQVDGRGRIEVLAQLLQRAYLWPQ